MQIRAAKPPSGGGDIIVDSADPSEGEQGTVGLQIRVLGSGFEKGAKVAFHLPGETDPDAGMTVQSTSFVSDTELIATTDIALDAEVSSRDISVSFRGRRGIGTERFHVKTNSGIGQLEGTPLKATWLELSGVMASDLSADYEDGVDGMAVHLSGVNGNLMFRTADPPVREVLVTVSGIAGDGYTRTFTNQTTVEGVLQADGLRGLRDNADGIEVIRTKLDSQFRAGGTSYLLRYGRDCSENFREDDDLVVVFDADGGAPGNGLWTLTGSYAVLCERVKKGKNKRVPVGGGDGAVVAPLRMVLVEQ
ncbi:MAG: hypothetical protein ACYTA3_01110 [Planctomycetota bacterium]